MLNSKQIGNITEVEIMLSFLKLGFNVLTPYGDCERYDFVVEINNKFYKIQSKTANSKDNGKSIFINCRSTHRKNGKCVHEKYDSSDIDFFANTYNGVSYLIPISECGSGKTLRFEETENCQKERVSFAKNYTIEEVIKRL